MRQSTQQRISEEYDEQAVRGPFLGICSEMSSDQIGDVGGFADCLNMMLFNGAAVTRPGIAALPVPDATSVIGSFITTYLGSLVGGLGIGTVAIGKNIYWWNGSGSNWTTITGPNLDIGLSITFPPCSTVVNNTVCFSHAAGGPVCQGWVPGSATYAALSGSAKTALCMMEFDNRLVVANTSDAGGGNAHLQRIIYTNSNDPTDWTSVNSGFYDVAGELGPIYGLAKIFQQGFAFSVLGITQMQLTGNGLSPFYLSPFGSRGKGLLYPFTLAKYGDEGAAYLGVDNVYFFDGTESIPIGDRPIDGNRRKGAWSAIANDVFGNNLAGFFNGNITGAIAIQLAGLDTKMYLLSIPNSGNIWAYNFKEENWTRHNFTIGGGVHLNTVGSFVFLQNSGAESVAISTTDTNVYSWRPGFSLEASWSITSGSVSMIDRRHNKHVNRFRFVYLDNQNNASISLSFTNEKGVNQTFTVTLGTNSGKQQVFVQPLNITGMFFTWVISGTSSNTLNISEVSSYYEGGGEYKNA